MSVKSLSLAAGISKSRITPPPILQYSFSYPLSAFTVGTVILCF